MRIKQSDLMLKAAGDSWLKRNRKDLGKNEDPIDELIVKLPSHFNVLEIGCSNGWRLKKLHDKYGCAVYGIDPSEIGIEEAIASGINAIRGTADNLPWADDSFDLVILGFCLAFIEPEDWFKVAHETTRVLKEHGRLIIYDFISVRPHKRLYSHLDEKLKDGPPIYFNYLDWPKFWQAHPGYHKQAESITVDTGVGVCILEKNFAKGIPIADALSNDPIIPIKDKDKDA